MKRKALEKKSRRALGMKAKMAASASAHIQKMPFSASLLIVFIITSCLSVKVDEETKVFIRLVIENGNKESTCFSNGPVRAFPRGTRIRNMLVPPELS